KIARISDNVARLLATLKIRPSSTMPEYFWQRSLTFGTLLPEQFPWVNRKNLPECQNSLSEGAGIVPQVATTSLRTNSEFANPRQTIRQHCLAAATPPHRSPTCSPRPAFRTAEGTPESSMTTHHQKQRWGASSEE